MKKEKVITEKELWLITAIGSLNSVNGSTAMDIKNQLARMGSFNLNIKAIYQHLDKAIIGGYIYRTTFIFNKKNKRGFKLTSSGVKIYADIKRDILAATNNQVDANV